MRKNLLIAVISSLLTASVIGAISYSILANENQLKTQYIEKHIEKHIEKYIEKHIGEVKSSQDDTYQSLQEIKTEISILKQTKTLPKEKNDIDTLLQEIDKIKAVNEHILQTLIESKLIFAKSIPKADPYSYSAKAKLNLMSHKEILTLSGFLKAQNRKINHLPDDTDLSNKQIRAGWYHYGTGSMNYLIKKHDLSILDLKAYCQIAGLFI
jgi:hypothetical protein